MATKPYILNQVGDTLNLLLTGEISDWWGVGLTQVAAEIKSVNPSTINVQINSGGGDLLEAQAIAAFLKAYNARVETTGMGLVASAATVILLASKNSSMAKNSWFMIHNPSSIAAGESGELRKTADLLDSMQDNLADMYVAAIEANGKETTKKEVLKMMNAETWLTAEQAKEMGFVANVVDGIEVLNKANAATIYNNCKDYKNAPKEFLNSLQTIINMPTENQNDATLWDKFLAFFKSTEFKNSVKEIQNETENEAAAEIEKAKELAKKHGFFKEEVATVTPETATVTTETATIENNSDLEAAKLKIKELEEKLGAPVAGADKASEQSVTVANKAKIIAPTEHHKEQIEAFTNQFK
jgi:ATP-dependent protease ClpP protease subunit